MEEVDVSSVPRRSILFSPFGLLLLLANFVTLVHELWVIAARG